MQPPPQGGFECPGPRTRKWAGSVNRLSEDKTFSKEVHFTTLGDATMMYSEKRQEKCGGEQHYRSPKD